MKMKGTASVLIALILCAGCAERRPVLYPNEAFLAEDRQTIDHEIDRCMRLAKSYTGDPDVERVRNTAEESALLSAAGAVTGTAIGAITGGVGRGAAIGAITGASGGVTRGIIGRSQSWDESNTLFRSFVERCLAERGLDTLGWK